MNRIWHPYYLWEDYKAGFYNTQKDNKKEALQKCIELYSNSQLFESVLNKVINEWKFSCEHNLTNESLNKIAYLGQAACAYYYHICSDISRIAFNEVLKEKQIIANQIALNILNIWKKKYEKNLSN